MSTLDPVTSTNTISKTPTPEHAIGIPNGVVSFRATLTATTNKYLQDRLPCVGLVQIGERDIHGRCIRTSFMPLDREGHTSFVQVPDAEYTFGSRV